MSKAIYFYLQNDCAGWSKSICISSWCSFSPVGPLHGGANMAVIKMLNDIYDSGMMEVGSSNLPSKERHALWALVIEYIEIMTHELKFLSLHAMKP